MRTSIALAASAAALLQFACGKSGNEVTSADAQLRFTHKPQIVIQTPPLGGHVATSSDGMLDVSGTTRGRSLSINGTSVAVDPAGRWSARIPATPGINVITANLNSLWGGEAQRAFVYGDFAPSDAAIPSGVLVRSNATAFNDQDGELDDFSAIAKAMLAQVDVMKLLKDVPPTSYDFGLGSVDIYVTDVQFARDQTQLALAPRAVGANIDGKFTSVVTYLHLVLHFLGDHPFNATAAVDTVGFKGDMNAAYSPTATPAGPGIAGSMGLPDIALGQMKITTDIDFPGVNDFITWLANDFSGLVATTVANAIQGNAANHFALALNQIGLPPSFDLGPYGIRATLLSSEEFDERTVFDDLGVTIGATTNFAWPPLLPNAPGNGTPGSFFVNSGYSATFPSTAFGVSVSFDALNQASHAIWGQDGLTQVVYPAKNYLLFKMDPVVASPKLPPVLVPTSDGRLELSLGDIIVTSTLRTWFFEGPVKVTISAKADVSLDVDPANGALRMTLSGAPTIYLDVNDVLGIIPDAFLGPLSEVLQQLAPTIVQKVVKPIEVPLPKLPLAALIPGSKGSLGLASPVTVAVDPAQKRVMVSGDLQQYQ